MCVKRCQFFKFGQNCSLPKLSIMIYHFKYPVSESELETFKFVKDHTNLDPIDDIGNFMIGAIFDYIPKINTMQNFGSVFQIKEMQCIGALLYSINDDICIIHKLGVLGDLKQQGIGSALVKYIIEYCYQKVNIVQLYTIDELNIIRFYEKTGFIMSNAETTKMILRIP